MRKEEPRVYLMKWAGRYFVRSFEGTELVRLENGLKDDGTYGDEVPVHYIRTDDPEGIKAYWLNRFRDRRAFFEGQVRRSRSFIGHKLTRSDIAAFRRRRFQ